MTSYPQHVEIIEVGLRDGLQREPLVVPTERKITLIDDLVDAGLRKIQVTSFVHPRLVPQMADAAALCELLTPYPDVIYSGLALNLKGVERALAAGLRQVDISVSASEPHSRRNANRGIDAAVAEFGEMAETARAAGLRVRGGIQCAFGYLAPDDVAAATVLRLAENHLRLGVDELALADSSGLANPRQLRQLLADLLSLTGSLPIILHLHDTRGMGLANLLAALELGIHHFDTAIGGLGGCPFIDGAAGNIATEDTVHMLQQMGIETGIDLPRLAAATRAFAPELGLATLPGKLYSLVQ